VARTFAKRFTARVEVRNAADNRYDVFDLASAVLLAPGRVITGSLSAAF
jgi:outer membrane receptor protein involved in Fe transport